MKIEFLGHAGFWITVNKMNILIDPWLIPSSIENPVLDCFVPAHKTIDYLIPEPIRNVTEIEPDIILVSHFHTHHAPKNEIDHWLKNSQKSITIVGPEIHPTHKEKFTTDFKINYPQHRLLLFTHDSTLTFDNISVLLQTHTSPFHLSYLIKFENKSFLHIADSIVSRMWFDRRLDPAWFKYKNLKPDFLALTVGHTSSRKTSAEKENTIMENSFLSPVEGARLTYLINPKNVAVIGIYNFSAWKNRTEYSHPYAEIENFFLWAVRHLNPDIFVQLVRPGNQYTIDDQKLILSKHTEKNN